MLQAVSNSEYYTYTDNNLSFTYYPLSGLVKGVSVASTYKAIEHFARIGFEVVWSESNIGRLLLKVKTPEHLTEEDSLAIIGQSKETLYAAYAEKIKSDYEATILGNIDNNTGKVLVKTTLEKHMVALRDNTNKTKQDVADWFDHFNIETVKKVPTVSLGTLSKRSMIDRNKIHIWNLFDRGELVRYTPEEYKEKMDKYKERI